MDRARTKIHLPGPRGWGLGARGWRLGARGWAALVSLSAVLVLAAGCGDGQQAKPPAGKWRQVASWKGRGNAQLDTFDIEQWEWRLRWETSNESPPSTGTFHVEPRSGDSGRTLADPIEVRGVGHDTEDFVISPHRIYLVVESKNVDWSIVVEEPAD
jgi:hypothetical protein